MAGSHSASLEALEAGQVDGAAASLNAHEKMVENGSLDPEKVVLLAKSEPIPSPPLAMHSGLSGAVKAKLRDAFARVHESEGVTPEVILGYGGKKVDRYNAQFDPAVFDAAMEKLSAVTDELKGEIIEKAGEWYFEASRGRDTRTAARH
jgi:phosphonate transport system substrate-binding protein